MPDPSCMELVVWRAVLNLVMTVPHAHSPVTVDLLWLRESVRIRPRQTIASKCVVSGHDNKPCDLCNLQRFGDISLPALHRKTSMSKTMSQIVVAFGRMARQYSYLKMMKRGGRGHEANGIVTTPPGALAVRCWACPDASRNLPSGWDKVPESKAYLLGVGKTDGESTERLWSLLNLASWSTKEMGEGARHDVLEDKIDLINFEKNRSMGRTLARRLIVAVAERQRQGIEFQELDDSVPKKKRREWAKMMDAWYKDNTQTNPFEVQGGKLAGPSEREISEELK
ncbi:CxC2 domain-containing protein [Mycena indigotica]|uniref:CxC2 domain-containing protein n=1 Tax=Mycena indigotica TaxID=2126181 RepID=A0A8H6SFT1_9AGAR|nr:CxC2 domain-containing protein [Mycena indigotica]KAF7297055.1 CxC2 domain-containing protein [Mycena indigotica]